MTAPLQHPADALIAARAIVRCDSATDLALAFRDGWPSTGQSLADALSDGTAPVAELAEVCRLCAAAGIARYKSSDKVIVAVAAALHDIPEQDRPAVVRLAVELAETRTDLNEVVEVAIWAVSRR